MEYKYLSGTVVPNEEAVTADDDSLVIRLDATPNRGRFEGNELFVFDKLLGEDVFPFKAGSRIEILIKEPCQEGLQELGRDMP